MKNAARLAVPILLLLAPAALAAEGGAKRELISIHFMEMVWSLVTFVIFFVVLSVLVWPKILKALQMRESRIRDDLVSAERSARQAEQTLGEYRQRLTDANVEVKQIIDQGRADAQQLASQIKEQTQDEITRMRQRAEAEIASAKQQAVGELYAEAAVLATDVAGRILKRQIAETDQQQLVDEALAEMGKASRN